MAARNFSRGDLNVTLLVPANKRMIGLSRFYVGHLASRATSCVCSLCGHVETMGRWTATVSDSCAMVYYFEGKGNSVLDIYRLWEEYKPSEVD